ncbi:outer dynein arm-docking complex subunit 4-like isoform X2 [Haliotis rubra]|uniref:outer dynein arm-docking complex subunit 4-like isoform X2 n=1 Tax=Haliotis rubra TaxID=36100 RepID=UPI001EE5FF02|nr:outer dynein arm-docking complex subunit 4-like isoform X2 [Haliotis rubra]
MPGRGRGRKDSESDNGTDNHDSQVTFETHRDEGEHFIHVKQYKRAIASFTKALDMRSGDRVCLVRRSNCYLMLGNAEQALADANECLEQDDEGKKDIKALCMKAEALYQKGDFETALVYYHRGNKLRPELQEFRLGIQKSQEAINNSIGTPESVKLETTGDLSYFFKQEEKQKQQQQSRGYSKPQQKKEDKKERKRPQSSSNSKTTKELLGELFADKEYLEKLYDGMTTTNTSNTTDFIKEKACDGLEYLGVREDFWRQQKPMYARKRDKQKQAQVLSSSGSKLNSSSSTDPMKYILIRLEQIDEAHAEGHYQESLQKSQKTLKRVEEWSENEVTNKQEVIANLHSCMGNAYLEMGKHDEALKHHEMDLDIGKAEDLDEVKSRALDNMGRVLARMGKYDKAIEVWEEKLPLSKTALEKTWLYHEIGRCYLEVSRYEDARDYGEKSLAAAREADDEGWQLHACVLVAQSEVKCNELQAAADSFERALEMAEAQQDSAAEQAIKKALEDVNDKIVRGVKDEPEEDADDKQRKSSQEEKTAGASEDIYDEDFEEDEGENKDDNSPKIEVEASKDSSDPDKGTDKDADADDSKTTGTKK